MGMGRIGTKIAVLKAGGKEIRKVQSRFTQSQRTGGMSQVVQTPASLLALKL